MGTFASLAQSLSTMPCAAVGEGAKEVSPYPAWGHLGNLRHPTTTHPHLDLSSCSWGGHAFLSARDTAGKWRRRAQWPPGWVLVILIPRPRAHACKRDIFLHSFYMHFE